MCHSSQVLDHMPATVRTEVVNLLQVAPASNRPAVLPDGSYATQVAVQESFTVSNVGIGLSTTNLRCDHGRGRFADGGLLGVHFWLLD